MEEYKYCENFEPSFLCFEDCSKSCCKIKGGNMSPSELCGCNACEYFKKDNSDNLFKCTYKKNNTENTKIKDFVNHPTHYSECSLECIEVMRITFGDSAVYNFCICNAFKYLWRYKFKNGDEDLKKAEWYVDYAEQMKFYENDVELKNVKKILKNHKKI